MEQHSAGLVRRQERVGLGKQRAVEQRGRHEQDGLRHHTGSMLVVLSRPSPSWWDWRAQLKCAHSIGVAMAESSWQASTWRARATMRRGSRVVWRRRVSCCDVVVWRASSWMFSSGSWWCRVVGRRDTQPQKACVVPPRCSEATSSLLPKFIAGLPLRLPQVVCTYRAPIAR